MNREEKREYGRKWKQENRERCKETRNNWRKKNKEKWNECCRIYVSKNKEKLAEYGKSRSEYINKYLIERRKNNIQFRLSGNLRSRFGECIRKNYKNGSSIQDLGCNLQDFIKYIENKWLISMTWENYGKFGWHLDHIIPLSSFDLTNRKELLKACHYTNYQPLWAADNIRKSNKLNFKLL